jgi:signal peptidase I
VKPTTVIALAAIAAIAYAARKHPPLSRFAVEGASMEPAYAHGDRVIVSRLSYSFRAPRAGDVVVVRDPDREGRQLLKRVAEGPEGANDPWALYVLGDNAPQSRDSRAFGAVSADDIVGKAILKY